jgi:site-specific recombinase XerD
MCGACASDDLLYKYAYTLCSPQTRRIILPTSRQDPAKNSPYNRAPSERSAVGRTAVEDFVHHLTRAERSPLTIKNYRCDLAAFARWFRDTTGDELTPALITPTDLRDYKRFLVDHRRLKPSSVNRQLATLKSFLTWAAAAGLLPAGQPPVLPKTVLQARQGPRWLDRRELYALRRAVERGGQIRDIALVTLLLNTGLRLQELCALIWREVRVTARTGLVTVTQGKGAKHRQLPLNAEARCALMVLGYAAHVGSNAPVLMGHRGRMTPSGVQRLLRAYGYAAHLEALSPHRLHHTFCKNLIDAGVGLEKVAALAGHESLETTRRYCTPSLKDLEHAVELIGEEA